MTSDAQRAANARNAQKSTGPTSESGKQRSSRNATKHGGYCQQVDLIVAGLLEEDYLEVQGFHDAMVADLAPKGALEEALASRVAVRIINSDRVDRLTARLVEGALLSPSESHLLGPARVEHDRTSTLLLAFMALNDDDEKPSSLEMFEEAVELLERDAPRRRGSTIEELIRGPSPQPPRPATLAEWRARFKELIVERHGSLKAAGAAVLKQHQEAAARAGEERRVEAGIEARRTLDEFERMFGVHERLSRLIGRDLAVFHAAKERRPTGT